MVGIFVGSGCQNADDLNGKAIGALCEAEAVQKLITLFNDLFIETYNTERVLGGGEPIYLPADDTHVHHRLIFAHGFFNSALHEIAHWCVAGSERRMSEDFGYWYEPDGRSLDQQKAFEKVEVAPQSIEWILAKSCGRRFRVSADNLSLLESGVQHYDKAFKNNIWKEVQRRFDEGLPERVKLLSDRLIECFQPGLSLDRSLFALEELA